MTETVVIEPQGELVAPEPKPHKRNGNGAIAKVDHPAPAPAPAIEPGGPSLLAILQAVMTDPNASIERMNNAFDFYQRIEASRARKAFDAAMAAAKADFAQITKKHEVSRGSGGTFKHEDLADIATAVDPALSANGLSYRFRAASNPNEPIKVTCVVTHRDGHFEETTLTAGADPSGGKNSIQAIGSTLSYLQRYSLRLALGIAAGREDDGQAAGERPAALITDAQCSILLDKIAETGSDTESFCAFFKIDGVAKLPANQFNRALGLLNQKGRKA